MTAEKPRIRRGRGFAQALLVVALMGWSQAPAKGQGNTRLLLASGSGVPGHPGFVFGPFSALSMNGRKQLAFLTSLESARSQLPAVVGSTGVTFSVVAFRGLLSPLSRLMFDSFGAPSINDEGMIAFSATLKSVDEGQPPSFGVFRVEGETPMALASAGQFAPGGSNSTFQEFSSPVIGSSGVVLFGAQLKGETGGSGLFLWTPQGIQAVPMPAGFRLRPGDMLQPIFQSQNESVWVASSVPVQAASNQFFRAAAIKNFQQLSPPPDASATVQVLPPAPGEKPVELLLVIIEGTQAKTMELEGDPAQPVMAKSPAGPPLDLPLGGVQGQVPGAVSGSVVIAAAPSAHPNDLGLYCFCGGELDRLTSPDDFTQVTAPLAGRPIVSITGDGKHTVAFVAPNGPTADSNAIYVTSLP